MLHNKTRNNKNSILWDGVHQFMMACLFLLLSCHAVCQPGQASAAAPVSSIGSVSGSPTAVPVSSSGPVSGSPTDAPVSSSGPASDSPTETPAPTEPFPWGSTEPPQAPAASVAPTPAATPGRSPSATQKPKAFSLQMKQKKQKIQLSWKKGPGASYYQIYRKESGKKWKKYKQTKKKKAWVSYASGKKCYLKVMAYNKKKQCVGTSGEYSFYIPKQPVGLHMVYQNPKTAKLSWKNVPRATSYLIYRKNGNGSAKLIKQTKKCEYADRGLSSGHAYQYLVQAVYREGKQKLIGKAAKRTYDNGKIVSTSHQKYSYAEMANDIAALSRKYPGVVHYQVIGTSEDGRNIYEVSVGNRSTSRSILVVSTLHAREYMASLLCMNQIEYYARNYREDLSEDGVHAILSRVCVRYIPMANPDGVTISQQGISGIRSKKLQKKLKKISKGVNTERWKANARGVDLNDNFPYQFQVKGEAGSQGYSGIRAANSKEASAIVRRIRALRGNALKAVVNYHAMGSIIYGSSYGAGSVSAADGTKRMYQAAREITGYGSAGGGGKTGSGGGLREYIMCELGLPSITLEIGRNACPGPISEFPSIWRRNANLVLREAALFK